MNDLASRALALTGQIDYRDWEFAVGTKGKCVYLRVQFAAPDVHTDKPEIQKGRKWLLSEHMTDSEIIQTAFLAVKTAELHEMHEAFLYKGARIFSPHFNLDELVEFTRMVQEDRRPEPV